MRGREVPVEVDVPTGERERVEGRGARDGGMMSRRGSASLLSEGDKIPSNIVTRRKYILYWI